MVVILIQSNTYFEFIGWSIRFELFFESTSNSEREVLISYVDYILSKGFLPNSLQY